MPYFMISLDTEAWDSHNFEVEAPTSGRALIRALEELDALNMERVLHSIHVGPASDTPTSDKQMASWHTEDHFKRLS